LASRIVNDKEWERLKRNTRRNLAKAGVLFPSSRPEEGASEGDIAPRP